jgi:hypothetical protein
MKDIGSLALTAGGLILVIGILGVVLRFFPPYDGEVALAGAVLFAAGVLSRSSSCKNVN